MSKILIVLTILMGYQFGHAQALTGDTMGVAATDLASLQSSITKALNPQSIAGNASKIVLEKTICAYLGAAVGQAFSSLDAIRFDTLANTKLNSDVNGLKIKYMVLIEILSNARNDFCIGDRTSVTAVSASLKIASLKVSEISVNLEELRKK